MPEKNKQYISVWEYENSKRKLEVIERVINKEGYIKYNTYKYKVRSVTGKTLGTSYHIVINKNCYWNNVDDTFAGYESESLLRGGSLTGKELTNCKLNRGI